MDNLTQKYVKDALTAVRDWHYILPTDVQRKLKLADAVLSTDGRIKPDELRKLLGTTNWVIARRSKRILERYGPNVICISQAKYHMLTKQAIESRVQS